jgi:K+-transporting ATPase ATPase C chain
MSTSASVVSPIITTPREPTLTAVGPATTIRPESFARVLTVAARTALVTLVLTGLLYPLAMTGIAQVVFPGAASGSLVANADGKIVGSKWIAQSFHAAAYFQPRPSAAGNGYDATSSGGSNLGPTSAKLRDRVKAEVARLRQENPEAPTLVPAELVTTSASGLDPDLSPSAAGWQISRVAKARGISADRIRDLLNDHVESRDLGLFGEPRVNVLLLNVALDRQFGPAQLK